MSELRKKSLFQQIADIVRKDIAANHQPGDRLPSDLEMARRFSVSNVTIREAMLSLCQEGLLERRHGSGTYVTRTEAITPSAAQKHVAIWTELDIAEPRTSWFYPRMIQGLRVFLEEQQVPCKLYLGRRKPWEPLKASTCPQLWKDIENNRISGVLALGANPNWLKPLEPAGVPIVGWIDWFPYRVAVDYLQMIRTPVEHLLKAGRKKIVLLRWDYAPFPARVDDEIGCAFEAITREFGALVRSAWIASDQLPTRHGAGWDAFHKLWEDKKNRPDGLVITDDLLFRDVAMAILSLDVQVPEELTVVTHSNKSSGIFHPFPTLRMEIDVDRVIRTMALKLLNLMSGKLIDKPSTIVPVNFIIDDGAIGSATAKVQNKATFRPRRRRAAGSGKSA